MKKYIIYYLFNSILLLTFSCNNLGNKEKGLLDLGESTPLSSVEYSEEIITTSPRCLMLLENNLFVFQSIGDDVAVIMDTETGKQTGTWGKKGKGPGEFIYAVYWGTVSDSNTVYLFDTNSSNKLRKYCFDKKNRILIQEDEVTFNPKAFVPKGVVLNNDMIVGNTLIRYERPGSSLALFDKNGNILSDIGRLPDEDHKTEDLRNYMGKFSSYGNSVVFTMDYFGYIVFYKISQDGSVSLEWDHYLEQPLYLKNNLLDSRQLKQGFNCVTMSKDFVFCLYCGKKSEDPYISETLLVFNHKGKLVKNFALDREVSIIAVSPDSKTIYASVRSPEAGIVRFFPELK